LLLGDEDPASVTIVARSPLCPGQLLIRTRSASWSGSTDEDPAVLGGWLVEGAERLDPCSCRAHTGGARDSSATRTPCSDRLLWTVF
jgi:hypothetical protein